MSQIMTFVAPMEEEEGGRRLLLQVGRCNLSITLVFSTNFLFVLILFQ
jgi:hypothetical protein